MGISIYAIVLFALSVFATVISVIAIWHINKMRVLYLADYIAPKSPGRAKWIKLSIVLFLVLTAIQLVGTTGQAIYAFFH